MKFKVGDRVVCLKEQLYSNGCKVPKGKILTIKSLLNGPYFTDFIAEEDHDAWAFGSWAFFPADATALEKLIYGVKD